jgi:hypothetical protein
MCSMLKLVSNAGYLYSAIEGHCSGKNERLEKASCLSAWEEDGDNIYFIVN